MNVFHDFYFPPTLHEETPVSSPMSALRLLACDFRSLLIVIMTLMQVDKILEYKGTSGGEAKQKI